MTMVRGNAKHSNALATGCSLHPDFWSSFVRESSTTPRENVYSASFWAWGLHSDVHLVISCALKVSDTRQLGTRHAATRRTQFVENLIRRQVAGCRQQHTRHIHALAGRADTVRFQTIGDVGGGIHSLRP